MMPRLWSDVVIALACGLIEVALLGYAFRHRDWIVLLKWLPFRPYSCVTCARRELYFTGSRGGGRH